MPTKKKSINEADRPACMEDDCDLPQHAEGRCYFHFTHLDRPAEGAPNVVVLDHPGEAA